MSVATFILAIIMVIASALNIVLQLLMRKWKKDAEKAKQIGDQGDKYDR